ncbi:hypothetical protein DFH09DRAFT_1320659 [Mycena vulgaris]|nr:hypothetical protein DFH09DRAFT_1320659 [Mycena vulgaris]
MSCSDACLRCQAHLQRPHPIDVLPSSALIHAALAPFTIFHGYPPCLTRLRNAAYYAWHSCLAVVTRDLSPPSSLLILCRLPPSLRARPILPRSNTLYPGPSPARSLLSRPLRFPVGHSLTSQFVLSSSSCSSSLCLRPRANPPLPVPPLHNMPRCAVPAIQPELELATLSLASSSVDEDVASASKDLARERRRSRIARAARPLRHPRHHPCRPSRPRVSLAPTVAAASLRTYDTYGHAFGSQRTRKTRKTPSTTLCFRTRCAGDEQRERDRGWVRVRGTTPWARGGRVDDSGFRRWREGDVGAVGALARCPRTLVGLERSGCEDRRTHGLDYYCVPADSGDAPAPRNARSSSTSTPRSPSPVDHTYGRPRIHPTSQSHRARRRFHARLSFDLSLSFIIDTSSSSTSIPTSATATPPPRRRPLSAAAASIWGGASEVEGGLVGAMRCRSVLQGA